MKLRIDVDLDVNIHGEIEISDVMWNSTRDRAQVKHMFVEKLTHQVRDALRESLARQLGTETITPDDVGAVRDLLEQALEAGPTDVFNKVGEAYHRPRRIAAANEGRSKPI